MAYESKADGFDGFYAQVVAIMLRDSGEMEPVVVSGGSLRYWWSVVNELREDSDIVNIMHKTYVMECDVIDDEFVAQRELDFMTKSLKDAAKSREQESAKREAAT